MAEVGKIVLGIKTDFGYAVRLFVNDFTPDVGMDRTSFVECSLPQYQAVHLDPDQWIRDTEVLGGEWVYPPCSFAFGHNDGSTTIYGYYVMEVTDNVCMWAGRLEQPYQVPTDDGQVLLNLVWAGTNCTPSSSYSVGISGDFGGGGEAPSS